MHVRELLLHDFYCADGCEISDGDESQIKFALWRGDHITKDLNDRTAVSARILQNVEVFEQRVPIAINVENPAAWAAHIQLAEPVLDEMQRHSVPAGRGYRDGIGKMSKTLRLIQVGILSLACSYNSCGLSPTGKILIGHPNAARVIAIRDAACGDSDRPDFSRRPGKNL